MDLHVELPDGTTKLVPVSLNCSVRAAVQSTALRAGLGPVTNKLSEFSLARNTDSPNPFVDVCWLDPALPLKDQSIDGAALNLLLLKKYFSANEDLGVIESNAVLLRNIYSQLRHTYVSGLYSCSPSEAALLSALVAKVEFNNTELGPGSLQKTGRLRHILPPMYLNTPGIEQNILKALSSLTHLNERGAREEFVQQVRKSNTFGLSFHSITLEERGGRKDALLGVGSEVISVLERENMKVLMQWKTADLTNHTYNNTSFSMTYGSEVITMVTNKGHMISAFLVGMGKGTPTNGKAERNSAFPNSHTEFGDTMGYRASSHIKSLGKKVEQFEKTRPNIPPRPGPRPPPLRPARPPAPRKHAALRSTKSVPISGPAQRERTPPFPEEGEGEVYETPVPQRQRDKKGEVRGQEQQKVTPLPTWEEARYETNEQAEDDPPPKTRPPLPPHPQLKPSSRLLKKKPISSISIQDSAETYLVPSSSSRKPLKHHHSDSDATQYITENGIAGSDVPTSPIYDEPLQPNEYAEPTISSPGLSRGRGGRHTAVKRKSQHALTPAAPTNTPANSVSPPPSSSSPAPPPTSRVSVAPPTTPAPPPPPPHGTASKPSITSSTSHSPPRFPAPPPPVYSKLTPEEDMKEVDDVFEAQDLVMQVKYSRDSNPIYDTIAALKVTSSLTSANDVTFHSFSSTLERRKKKGKSQAGLDSHPKAPSSSSSPPSSVQNENSELMLVLSKDITRKAPLLPPGGKSEGGPKEKPRQKTPPPDTSPSPPPQRSVITKLGVIQNGDAAMADKPPARPSHAPITKPKKVSTSTAPPPPEGGRLSHEYNRLEHYPAKAKPPPPLNLQDNTSMADSLDHEYAEVNDPVLTGVKGGPKSMAERCGWVVLSLEDRDREAAAPGTPERRRPLPITPLIPVDVAGGGAGGEAKGGEGEGKGVAPPKPPRVRQRREKMLEKGEGLWRGHKAIASSDVLRDYSTLMKDFRIFHIKLPTGITHTELANINSEVSKLIKRLCVLLCISDPDHYSLYVEGASLTSVHETSDEEGGDEAGLVRKLRQKSPALLDHFHTSRIFTSTSEQNPNPVRLDPSRSFRSQGITNSRILALRPQTMLTEKLLRFQIRVPDWVRFHQCWLSVVQGNHPCSVQDAIKLGALQYQAYFLDRIEINSVIGFCRSSEFLPQEYAAVKGVEEKVLAEQQQIKGYSRRQAQDSYIFTACALPTYNIIFFPCMEVKRRVIQHNKLAPVLIGIKREGVVRADSKTKEILDEWSFQVLKNWGYTDQTFILEFDDRTYPLRTNQGRWMNALVDFHVEAIIGNLTTPPVTHQELGYNASSDDVVPIPHNRDNVDEIYSDLLSVRAQAQQWLENSGKTSPPSSSSPPPASSTETPLPTPTSKSHPQTPLPLPPPNTQPKAPASNPTPQPPPAKPDSPPVYEEVDFEPNRNDVVKNMENDGDAIYDLPPDM